MALSVPIRRLTTGVDCMPVGGTDTIAMTPAYAVSSKLLV